MEILAGAVGAASFRNRVVDGRDTVISLRCINHSKVHEKFGGITAPSKD
jgi:hypothetical protein